MNPENRWILLAESIPWDDLELMYADLRITARTMPITMDVSRLDLAERHLLGMRAMVSQKQ